MPTADPVPSITEVGCPWVTREEGNEAMQSIQMETKEKGKSKKNDVCLAEAVFSLYCKLAKGSLFEQQNQGIL